MVSATFAFLDAICSIRKYVRRESMYQTSSILYPSWMDGYSVMYEPPLSSIDIWLVKNESLEKKKEIRTQMIGGNGLEKSWQIGNMIGNGISEIGLLASSI